MGGNLIHVALASKEASLLACSGQGWCFYSTFNAYIFAQVLFVYKTTGTSMKFIRLQTILIVFSQTGEHWLASLASLSTV